MINDCLTRLSYCCNQSPFQLGFHKRALSKLFFLSQAMAGPIIWRPYHFTILNLWHKQEAEISRRRYNKGGISYDTLRRVLLLIQYLYVGLKWLESFTLSTVAYLDSGLRGSHIKCIVYNHLTNNTRYLSPLAHNIIKVITDLFSFLNDFDLGVVIWPWHFKFDQKDVKIVISDLQIHRKGGITCSSLMISWKVSTRNALQWRPFWNCPIWPLKGKIVCLSADCGIFRILKYMNLFSFLNIDQWEKQQ